MVRGKPILSPSRPTASARRLLAEMVALPSVHPEADAGGSPPGEAAMAQWLAAHLRRLGAAVDTPLLAPGRPNVIGVFEPARPFRSTVLLLPHLDTVGVAGMSVPPFRLTHGKKGRLHGRGACDTKGPLAALLAALAAPATQRALAHGDTRWIVAATAGEEQGSLGASALLGRDLRGDFAVALEPTGLSVVHGAKGLLRVWIDVPGRAAHGSTPERGVNAVYEALPLISALRDEFAPWLASAVDDVLGHGTINLGVLRGGNELNIVPDACRLGLDIRLPRGLTPATAVLALRKLMQRQARGAKLTIHRSGPAFVTERSSPWASCLRKVARGWSVADWFCDANVAAARDIPAVAFGPGSIRQAHTRDEYILQSELEAGVRAFRGFLCGAPNAT